MTSNFLCKFQQLSKSFSSTWNTSISSSTSCSNSLYSQRTEILEGLNEESRLTLHCFTSWTDTYLRFSAFNTKVFQRLVHFGIIQVFNKTSALSLYFDVFNFNTRTICIWTKVFYEQNSTWIRNNFTVLFNHVNGRTSVEDSNVFVECYVEYITVNLEITTSFCVSETIVTSSVEFALGRWLFSLRISLSILCKALKRTECQQSRKHNCKFLHVD